MPDSKISQLSNGNPAQSGDEIPINRAGYNFKITAASIADLKAAAGSNTQLQFNNSGAFGGTSGITTTGTELIINSGTKTASTPLLDLSQTWNNSGVQFTGLRFEVTDTASNANSWFVDFRKGGNSVIAISKSGVIQGYDTRGTTNGASIDIGNIYRLFLKSANNPGSAQVALSTASFYMISTHAFGWTVGAIGNEPDTTLYRDAANIIAQRNGANAQTFRIYNTYSSSTNYERGYIGWDNNTFKIGVEAGTGGGSVRTLQLIGAGSTSLTLSQYAPSWTMHNGAATVTLRLGQTSVAAVNNNGTSTSVWGGDIGSTSFAVNYIGGVKDGNTGGTATTTYLCGGSKSNAGSGNGGHLNISGGAGDDRASGSGGTGGNGGSVYVYGGYGTINGNGGVVYIDGGLGVGSGSSGNVIVGETRGSLLVKGGGTVTASAPPLQITQTWNNAAVAFTGLKLNVTNTASDSGSLLADFQVGGSSKFKIDRNGAFSLAGSTSGVVTVQTAAEAGTWSLTLPTTAGSNGQALTTNGSGVASWSTVTTAPGGSDTQLQYNSSGAFAGTSGITTTGTELTVASGTKTTSTPVLDLSQTWNDAAVTFTGVKINVTNTASFNASKMLDIQVGGTSIFETRRNGFTAVQTLTWNTVGVNNLADTAWPGIYRNHDAQLTIVASNVGVATFGYRFWRWGADVPVGWTSTAESSTGTQDLILVRDAAAILAQRDGVNAQTFRIYNTYSSSTNYERGFIRWNANVLEVGCESAGTGLARNAKIFLSSRSDQYIQGSSDGYGSTYVTRYGVSWGTSNQGVYFPLGIALDGEGRGMTFVQQAHGATPSYTGANDKGDGLIRVGNAYAPRPNGGSLKLLASYGTTPSSAGNGGYGGSVKVWVGQGGAPNGAGSNGVDGGFEVLPVSRAGTIGTSPVFRVDYSGSLTIADAANLVFNTNTGTKIGTATDQKLGFWNATPVIQPTTSGAAATFAAETSGIVNDTATFDGYTIGQVVKALRAIGILA